MSAASRIAELIAASALAVGALAIAAYAGVKDLAALPNVARGVVATLALFTLAGYAPARLLVPRAMWPHFPLLVPIVGSAVAGLGLTALGFLGIPFGISLPVLLGLAAVAGLSVRAWLGPARPAEEERAAAGGWRLSLAWPAYLATVIVLLLVVPVLSNGYVTVQGTNPDALLGVGTAEFLQEAHPASVEPALAVDQMPYVWRSKYPIYYALAAAAALSGLDATQAFAAFAAVLAALTAAAFLLLARYGLRAGPRAALLAMALVGLDRAVAYLALHPYHNQLWGTVALAPMLLFGLRLLERPNRRDAALFGGFLLLGLAAYPLMVLFPALAFSAGAVVAHRRGHLRLRRPRLPGSRSRRIRWVAAGLAIAPAALALAIGVTEKSLEAAEVLVSNGSLAPWRGDLRVYPPPGFFVGVTGTLGVLAVVGTLGAAALAVRHLPPVRRAGFAAMLAGGLLVGLFFRFREFGEYFYFKVFAFLTPLVLVAAAVWLAGRCARRGRAGTWALIASAVLVTVQLAGLRREVADTGVQLDRQTLELRDAADRLPRDASLRLDVIPDGRQLWAAYVLSEHRLTTLTPLVGTTYPHPPRGRKADFIVVDARLSPEAVPDAVGPPLLSNEKFRLFKMRADVPGADRASRRMVNSRVRDGS